MLESQVGKVPQLGLTNAVVGGAVFGLGAWALAEHVIGTGLQRPLPASALLKSTILGTSVGVALWLIESWFPIVADDGKTTTRLCAAGSNTLLDARDCQSHVARLKKARAEQIAVGTGRA